MHGGLGLLSAPAWLTVRTCFHAQLRDPRKPLGATATGAVHDADAGLTNVVLWDVAFLAFAQQTPLNGATMSIGMLLRANVIRHSGSSILSRLRLCPSHSGTEQARTWHADGLGQRFTVWCIVWTVTTAHLPKPRGLQQMLRGCNVSPFYDPRAPCIQQNPTGLLVLGGRAATAPGNWVLGGQEPADRRRWVHDGDLSEPLVCSGGRLVAAAAEEGSEAAWRTASAASGPLLHVRLARGASVSYTTRREARLRGPPGLR